MAVISTIDDPGAGVGEGTTEVTIGCVVAAVVRVVGAVVRVAGSGMGAPEKYL